MPARLDRTGERFGRLVVVSPAASKASGTRWLCRCDCGAEIAVFTNALRNGHTRSCGCLRKESSGKARFRHGAATVRPFTPTYRSWASMRKRVHGRTFEHYESYVRHGIKVCSRWDSFVNFLADMGERPDGHTLDRIDVSKDYEPNNCRWATHKVQANNRRLRRSEADVIAARVQYESRIQ